MEPDWFKYAAYGVWLAVGLGYVLLLLIVGAMRGRLGETIRGLPGVFFGAALVGATAWIGMQLLTHPVTLR
jgi:hypothetical protein